MHNPTISVCRDVYRQSLSGLSLEWLHREIRGTPQLAGDIWNLRAYRKHNPEHYNSHLKRIPVVFASGTFESMDSASPKEHSLLVSLSYRNIETPAEVRNQLGELPHTALAFIDADGVGVCAFLRIQKATTVETHARAWESTAAMIRDQCGIDATVDENAKVLNKRVLMSSDRNAIINLDAEPFDWEAYRSSPAPTRSRTPKRPKKASGNRSRVVKQDISPQRHQILNRLSQLGKDETIGLKELVADVGMDYNNLRFLLHKMHRVGQVARPEQGRYNLINHQSAKNANQQRGGKW